MATPTQILPTDQNEMKIAFDTGESFMIPYLDLRFECPCATCVDEITGQRTLKRETLNPLVKPKSVEPVGRYGIKVTWSDGHSTGMYHFDRLYHLGRMTVKK
jgi:DUF971 family protein